MSKQKISEKNKYDYSYVKKYFEKEGCKLLSKKYNGCYQKLSYICNCGNKHKITFNSFVQGHRCPKCAIKRQVKNSMYSQEEFKKRVKEVHGDDIEVLGKYKGGKRKVRVKCNKCGYIWNTYLDLIYHAQCGCTNCSSNSKGEELIRDWLDKNNYKYEREKTFTECKDKRALYFDFAVKDNNGIKLLIEYDGKQHFEPIKYFGGKENFKIRQKRDKIKNEFCFKNKIPLIRIPYWEKENIEPILERALNNANRYSIYNIHN